MRKLVFTLLLAVTASFTAIPSALAQTEMTFTVDGIKRIALVFAPPPATTGAQPHPLIFAFHGHGGNMQAAAQGMHLQTLWPEAVVVYPQGLKTPSTIDPQGLFPGWQSEAGQVSNRDLKFFDAMLATLRQKYDIDDQRIYATGFSNGAIFTYLLWAERGKTLVAFGICAGRLWPSDHLTVPRAVLVIGGENDQVVPFNFQQQSIQTDRQIDNATGPGQACGAECTLYPSTSHTPVVTRIHPGGHVYPPWAPDAIVEFFKNHKRP